SVFLFATFYAAMAGAAFLIELLFQVLHLIPIERNAQVLEAGIQFNYTTVLNILFLIMTAILLQRFLKTGGPAMLQMMNHPEHTIAHAHHHNPDQM
ncbi:MAG: permease, partial [Verrucomicrobia bacterium]|nr:permease [Leptolyngbya sp. ES-bin-22]